MVGMAPTIVLGLRYGSGLNVLHIYKAVSAFEKIKYPLGNVDVDARPCPLNRTASLPLYSFKVILAPRGPSEIILESAVAPHNPPRCVSTPPI